MDILLIILVILASFLCLQCICYMWLVVGIKRQKLDDQRAQERSMYSPTDLLTQDWTGGD
jgi:sensor domain CHASE-containing protein